MKIQWSPDEWAEWFDDGSLMIFVLGGKIFLCPAQVKQILAAAPNAQGRND